jgi:phage antirepressor YoqD-like protein
MINSRPNNKNYHQGNYIPKNKDKVIKLNSYGGVFFRSSWEKKIISWLDLNESVIKWSSESLKIPYQITHVIDGVMKIKEHNYYPDFFYEMRLSDGTLKQVVAEVKPKAEYNDAIMFSEGKFQTPDGKASLKKLQSLEYRFKQAQKNFNKWETMIKWCEKKGYNFIIITEDHLKKFNL